MGSLCVQAFGGFAPGLRLAKISEFLATFQQRGTSFSSFSSLEGSRGDDLDNIHAKFFMYHGWNSGFCRGRVSHLMKIPGLSEGEYAGTQNVRVVHGHSGVLVDVCFVCSRVLSVSALPSLSSASCNYPREI